MTRAQSLLIKYKRDKDKQNYVPLEMYMNSIYEKYCYIERMCGLEPLSKGKFYSQKV